MILVTLGTTKFDSLIEYIDQNQICRDEMVLQIADGEYLPKNRKYYRYLENYESWVEQANIIICHGGAGTLFKMLRRGKKVIALNNSDRKDQHQTDLISELERQNYLIWCKNMNSLATEIESIQNEKHLVTYKPEPCFIVNKIEQFFSQRVFCQ